MKSGLGRSITGFGARLYAWLVDALKRLPLVGGGWKPGDRLVGAGYEPVLFTAGESRFSTVGCGGLNGCEAGAGAPRALLAGAPKIPPPAGGTLAAPKSPAC